MRGVGTVVCIGDGIVDQVNSGTTSRRFPGGAALNLAVALRRLGVPSALLADMGWDADGQWVRSFLGAEGVRVLPHPTVSFTGVAVSDRVHGEPTYSFSRFRNRRRIRFGPGAPHAIRDAVAVAVNSYALWDEGQAESLREALSGAGGLRVVDTNPRAGYLGERDSYVRNFEGVARSSHLVKLSAEDVRVLYGGEVDDVVRRLVTLGVNTIFLTRGADGASVYSATGVSAHVEAAKLDDDVVDTMGAGDASLAALIARILSHGLPPDSPGWADYLRYAMLAAGITCRHLGGATAAPMARDLADFGAPAWLSPRSTGDDWLTGR
jgi:fructokinase